MLRHIHRTYVSIALILVFVSMTAFKCDSGAQQPSREDYIRYARTTVTALKDVIPILRANNVNVAKFEKGVNIGDRLVTAFENNQSADAIALTSALMTTFEEVVVDVNLIPNQKVQTIVLIGLAVGHVALQHLADLMDKQIAQVESSGLKLATGFQNPQADAAKATIKEFRKKKQWRCKDAKTGKFAKMEFCKEHPELSYVVTFYKKK